MIKRRIYPFLLEHLTKKEISLITGPRQSGKTTLMQLLKAELDQKGQPTLFLNFDVEWDRVHLKSQAAIISKLELDLGKKGGFVFIDEIQRKEDAGRFLKGLYDMKLPYKIIASGSGSLELKEKIHESLVGRKRLFELDTLDFQEFVDFKTGYKYSDDLQAFFKVEVEKAHHLLMEYMNFGGYPRVVLEERRDEKVHAMDEIYRSVLERDVAYLLRVEKTEAFNNLIKVLAGQIGNLVNYKELSSTLGISFPTLKKYLWYAQKIFLLDLVKPYSRNIRKEISQSPVVYFRDLGMRNFPLGLFGNTGNSLEGGFLFQNLVFRMLIASAQTASTRVHFWRTKDKAEVDFVVEKGKNLAPFEVKFKSLKDIEIPRALIHFCNQYSPDEAYVVNLNLEKKKKMGKTDIMAIPYWQLLEKYL